MWPWLNTAVLSRDGDHRRISSCSKGATTEERVSTMNSPASVDPAVAFAKLGRKATPSATSTSPPMWLTGWSSAVVISPRQRRSAVPRMSSTTASGARRCAQVAGLSVLLSSFASSSAVLSCPSLIPFSNSDFAEPRPRAIFGSFELPKTSSPTAITMRTTSRLSSAAICMIPPWRRGGPTATPQITPKGGIRIGAAEDEQSDGNHDEDHVQAFKRRYLHDPSLAAGGPTDSPRIYPQRWIRGLQPASSTPRTTATIEAVPATDPQTASAGRVLARACSHAAIPARTTIAILTPRTTFQACVEEDVCPAETFQNPVRIRTRNAGQLIRANAQIGR